MPMRRPLGAACGSLALPTPQARVAALYVVCRAGTMLIASASAQLLKPSESSKRKIVDRVAGLLEMDVQHAMEQEAAKNGEKMRMGEDEKEEEQAEEQPAPPGTTDDAREGAPDDD